MQEKKASFNVPVGIKPLSKMMKLSESELSFFPKLEKIRENIQCYNFNQLTKNSLFEKLEKIKEECKKEGLETYIFSIDELIESIRYKY